MPNEGREFRDCPLCKESILSEALKCKHCGSAVAAENSKHEGICPFCKEDINPEAIKCKHCRSNLDKQSQQGCGCGTNLGNIERAPQFPNYDMSDQTSPESSMQSMIPGGAIGPGAIDSGFASANYRCVDRLIPHWNGFWWTYTWKRCCYSPITGTWACI